MAESSAGTYAALAQLAVSFYDSYNKRQVAQANDAAAASVAAARSRVRDASNMAASGHADLQRFMLSLNNQAQRASAEKSAAALRAQIGAQNDNLAARTFEGRLSAATRQGQVTAQAAAMGVTGGSTALVAGTLALAQARQEYADRRSQEMRDSGLAIQSAATSASSIAGMDQRTVFAAFDRTVDSPVRSTASGDLFTDLLYAVDKVGARRVVNAAEDASTRLSGIFNAPPAWPDQTEAETARLNRLGDANG